MGDRTLAQGVENGIDEQVLLGVIRKAASEKRSRENEQ